MSEQNIQEIVIIAAKVVAEKVGIQEIKKN
jgi:hypothetical protein